MQCPVYYHVTIMEGGVGHGYDVDTEYGDKAVREARKRHYQTWGTHPKVVSKELRRKHE